MGCKKQINKDMREGSTSWTRTLHKGKAIESYCGAKLSMKSNLVYPSYVLLKESLRSSLAYIMEGIEGVEYSTKTKLDKLINDLPGNIVSNEDFDNFEVLLELEREGLNEIMLTDINELEPVRKSIKKLIGVGLGHRL